MFVAVAVEVQVALVTAASSVIVALGAGVVGLLNKRATGRVEERLGNPNGRGDLVAMVADVQRTLTNVVAGQAGQDNRIARLEGNQNEIRSDVDRLTGRVDVLERRPPAA